MMLWGHSASRITKTVYFTVHNLSWLISTLGLILVDILGAMTAFCKLPGLKSVGTEGTLMWLVLIKFIKIQTNEPVVNA